MTSVTVAQEMGQITINPFTGVCVCVCEIVCELALGSTSGCCPKRFLSQHPVLPVIFSAFPVFLSFHLQLFAPIRVCLFVAVLP